MASPCSLALALTALAVAGCNNDPLKKVPVRGVVTFDEGSCPAPGRVVFLTDRGRRGVAQSPRVRRL